MHILLGEVLVIVVVDLDHRGVHTGSQTLNLREREEIVLGGASCLNVEVLLDGIQDLVGPAQPARGRRAYLQMVFAHRVPHEHGVEGCHLVYTHTRYADVVCNAVHCADGQPAAVLSLGQVQQRNNRGSLVSVWVDGHDSVGSGQVLSRELERSLRIVLRSISVNLKTTTPGPGNAGGQRPARAPRQGTKGFSQHSSSLVEVNQAILAWFPGAVHRAREPRVLANILVLL